jgi:hypothetical protein
LTLTTVAEPPLAEADLYSLASAWDDLGIEVWRIHPTWGHLAVSNVGRVRSLSTGKLLGYQSGPRGGERTPNPYLRVKVQGNRSAAVSVLVLEAFVGPRPPGHEGDHENHDSLDNRLVNLRWLPSAENQARKATRYLN